ncbi:MAG: RHS repeat-associated core domain-containing protein [Bacillota bacterium]
MYDPKIARFLQEDTYTGTPDDPLSLNLYTYVKNNPLIYFDPTGHAEARISYWIYKSDGHYETTDEFINRGTGDGRVALHKIQQANQLEHYATRNNLSPEARAQLQKDAYYIAEQGRAEYAEHDLIYGRLKYGEEYRKDANLLTFMRTMIDTEQYFISQP